MDDSVVVLQAYEFTGNAKLNIEKAGIYYVEHGPNHNGEQNDQIHRYD
jgi:hypothetical protein